MKVPCENIIWYLLPAIRKELISSMIGDHELNQRSTAKLMGLSDAAVSQYLSNKRGKLDIKDKSVQSEIRRSAERIVKNGGGTAKNEICRLCSLIRKDADFEDNLGKCAYENR